MALTSKATKTIEIPGEPGQTITIRKLSHRQIKEARDAKVEASLRMAVALGELKITQDSADRARAEREAEKPENQYDVAAVLRAGIVAWTYDAVLPDEVDELDEETAAWAFDAIIAFSFRSANEGEASAAGSQSSTSLAASEAGPQS